MKNTLLLVAVIAIALGSCKKPDKATYEFDNRIADYVSLTVNGNTTILAPNDTLIITGEVGGNIDYTAYSLVDSSNGVLGNASWKGKTKYNSDGVVSSTILSTGLADPTTFHLIAINQSGQTLNKLVVKSSDTATDSAIYNINVAADGLENHLGYYPKDSFTVVDLYNSSTLVSHNTVYNNSDVKNDGYYNITFTVTAH